MKRLMLLGALAAATITATGVMAAEAGATRRIEPLYAARIGPEGLTARVPSNGCTAKESFKVELNHEDGVAKVWLVRTESDLCRGYFPAGVVLTWTRADLGLAPAEPAQIGNPVVSAR